MARSPGKPTVEWAASQNVFEAIEGGARLWPHLKRPEVIERLLLTGWSAVTSQHWVPPQFLGRNRHHWKVPESRGSD